MGKTWCWEVCVVLDKHYLHIIPLSIILKGEKGNPSTIDSGVLRKYSTGSLKKNHSGI